MKTSKPKILILITLLALIACNIRIHYAPESERYVFRTLYPQAAIHIDYEHNISAIWLGDNCYVPLDPEYYD